MCSRAGGFALNSPSDGEEGSRGGKRSQMRRTYRGHPRCILERELAGANKENHSYEVATPPRGARRLVKNEMRPTR